MTKTPLVVRWNTKFGHWNITIGKSGSTVNTQGIDGKTTATEQAETVAVRQDRPGVIVLGRDGDITMLSPNNTYWMQNGWTNEHPGPLIITPTTDDRWAVQRGRFKIIDAYQTKGEAVNQASIMADDSVPAIVKDDASGDYQSTDLRPEY